MSERADYVWGAPCRVTCGKCKKPFTIRQIEAINRDRKNPVLCNGCKP